MAATPGGKLFLVPPYVSFERVEKQLVNWCLCMCVCVSVCGFMCVAKNPFEDFWRMGQDLL